jgi:hypothetical protein
MPLINPAAASEVLGHRSRAARRWRAVAAASPLPAWCAMPALERRAATAAALAEERRSCLCGPWPGRQGAGRARVEVARGLTAWEYLVGEGGGRRAPCPPRRPALTYTCGAARAWWAHHPGTSLAIPAWKLAPALVTATPWCQARRASPSATLIVAALEAAASPRGDQLCTTPRRVALVQPRGAQYPSPVRVGAEVNQAAAGRLAKVRWSWAARTRPSCWRMPIRAGRAPDRLWAPGHHWPQHRHQPGAGGAERGASAGAAPDRARGGAGGRPPLTRRTPGALDEEAVVTRVLGHIQTASAEGATLVTGGERLGGRSPTATSSPPPCSPGCS